MGGHFVATQFDGIFGWWLVEAAAGKLERRGGWGRVWRSAEESSTAAADCFSLRLL